MTEFSANFTRRQDRQHGVSPRQSILLTGIDDRQFRVGFYIDDRPTATLNFLPNAIIFREKARTLASSAV